MVGINLAGRDYTNIVAFGPGHHPANIGQNLPVVSYTRIAPRKKEISLRIDIYQNPPAPLFNQLPNHFFKPSPYLKFNPIKTKS
jgi:hypothetical protein